MDSKSILQQRVLGLRRGYTAKNIRYNSSHAKHGQWKASLSISFLDFPTTDSFNSKRQAETEAAQACL